jgi:hypothetical protein
MEATGLSSTVPKERPQELAFTVQTIDCITCSPIFRRPLARIDGVLEVKELPITNKIIVVFDGARLERRRLAEEVNRVARRAGLGGKIIFVG